VDYIFVDKEVFAQWVKQDKLVEYAEVFGHWYGSPREPLERALQEGKLYLMEVDVEGGESVRRAYPDDSVSIFVRPPTSQLLKERLEHRETDTPAQIAQRLERVAKEMQYMDRYDWQVVNDDLSRAVVEVKKLIRQTQERRSA
jgi:guanylate kinase